MRQIIISFPLLFDIEYALYKYLYNNKDNNFSLNSDTDEYLKELIKHRETDNPLCPIYVGDNSDLDELYKSILENKYNDILSYIKTTNIVDFVDFLIKSKRYNVLILCKNKLEELVCKKYNYTTYTFLSHSDLNDKFDTLYFRYFDEVDEYVYEGKNLYFSNTTFNNEKTENLLYLSNIVKLIDIY